MSLIARTSSPPVVAPATADAPATPAASSSARRLGLTLLTLALVYLAMLNPYWVPSGDGEVYTCIARSLVLGEGLKFNGFKAAIAPPGWPIVLAAAMRISPEFWFLKLVVIACMLASFVPAFYILRRFASDRMAAGVLLLTGTLSTVYPLTYWMHTEAFFCLLGFTALLIAFRIRERRARGWEAPAMLALLAAAAFTRWPGVLHIALVVPILLSGDGRPWQNGRRWLLVAAVFLAPYATFKGTYQYLSLSPEEQAIAFNAGGVGESETGDEPVSVAVELPTTTAATGPADTEVIVSVNDGFTPGATDIRGNSKRGPAAEVAYRVSSSARWFAWLLWQPTRFGQSVGFIDVSAMVAGWLAIGMLMLTMLAALPRREYFWVGLAAYTGGLCLIWPNPNARYFVPVAPFIVLGILRGTSEVSKWFGKSRGVRSASRVLATAFVAATLLANLPLLAIDVAVFRSSDFYGRYEAGSNKDLINVAAYIRNNPRPGTIAVSEWYMNMGRGRYSKYGMRALHLLTNRPIVGIERKSKLRNRPTDSEVRKWLKYGVEADYSVYQSDWNPWRVWHFRLSPSLQEALAGQPANRQTGGWELFGRENAKYPRINDIPEAKGPRRVPGL